VTLLGDAAHPMLQYLAQGAGQAIEDAVVLGEAMRHTGGDFAQAFQLYQQARYLRTGRVQLTARFYGDIYHASRRHARTAQPHVPERPGVGGLRRPEVDVRRHRTVQTVPIKVLTPQGL
jgi:2-polyprenyl-6-methoxyphenol hydroxylase-like FAD-dependent oxidoreductase